MVTRYPEEIMQYAWWLMLNCDLFADIEDKIGAATELTRIIHDVYHPAWKAHPDYYSTDFSQPYNPTVIAVYEHEAFKGHTESYMIAGLSDLLAPAQMEWGKRTLGTFRCIRPIRADIPVHRYRISYLSWSIKGSGRAFRCRQELKSLLPTKYHPLVSLARKAARAPKHFHLSQWMKDHQGEHIDLRNRSILPDWYNRKTRQEMNRERFIEMAGGRLGGLSRYITLENFWAAATGQCHPDEVQTLITHQMGLPGLILDE